jgi:hypothetical protein
MPLDGTPYATQNANQQGQQKRRAAANVPAPYQTPTYGDVLKDARAGVQEPGAEYGLDRMTGQPFSVGRMQQQGIGEANRFVDRAIYRRAMTDPRSLSPGNRTGIAPINLMAENDRRMDLAEARQAMAEAGAARRERLTADAMRQGEESGNYNQILRGNMALDRAYYMNKYGTPRSPGQMDAWAERADARQRMLDRKAAFERAKYGRIALDRYGILPDMATANLYAMTNQPVETMTAMGALNAADAASEQAKAQMEYQKGMFEQQARQAEMDSLTTLITTPGIDQQTQRKAQKRLFELSSGLTGQGATQAGPPGQAGPSEAVKALTPMQAANMNPQERQDVIDTAKYDEGLKQYFPDMKDPQSIAWTMGEKLRYGVVPPEDVLQKLSNYVNAMGAVDTTFRAGSQRRLPTLFGLSGGNWRVYDDIINAPPGKKREAALRTLRDVYKSGSVALLPQEDQQILAGIQAPPGAPPQAAPTTPATAAPPRPASPQAPAAPQATAPPAAPAQTAPPAVQPSPASPAPQASPSRSMLQTEQPWMSTEPLEKTIPSAFAAAMQGMRSIDDVINSYLSPPAREIFPKGRRPQAPSQQPTRPATPPPATAQPQARPVPSAEEAAFAMAEAQNEAEDIESQVSQPVPKTPLQQVREATQASLPQQPAVPQSIPATQPSPSPSMPPQQPTSNPLGRRFIRQEDERSGLGGAAVGRLLASPEGRAAVSAFMQAMAPGSTAAEEYYGPAARRAGSAIGGAVNQGMTALQGALGFGPTIIPRGNFPPQDRFANNAAEIPATAINVPVAAPDEGTPPLPARGLAVPPRGATPMPPPELRAPTARRPITLEEIMLVQQEMEAQRLREQQRQQSLYEQMIERLPRLPQYQSGQFNPRRYMLTQ